VELNTISVSFACLSTLMSSLHAYMAARLLPPGTFDPARLPPNDATGAIASALAAAHAAVGAPPGAAILMVVQPGERNAYDQQWLQTTLRDAHGIATLRLSLAEVAARCSLGPDGLLRCGDTALTVAYYRSGYTPNDYPTETEWAGRALIEASGSAKCPSVTYQLAGAKKVQQDLARPGALERFIPDAADAARLRECFAGACFAAAALRRAAAIPRRCRSLLVAATSCTARVYKARAPSHIKPLHACSLLP